MIGIRSNTCVLTHYFMSYSWSCDHLKTWRELNNSLKSAEFIYLEDHWTKPEALKRFYEKNPGSQKSALLIIFVDIFVNSYIWNWKLHVLAGSIVEISIDKHMNPSTAIAIKRREPQHPSQNAPPTHGQLSCGDSVLQTRARWTGRVGPISATHVTCPTGKWVSTQRVY